MTSSVSFKIGLRMKKFLPLLVWILSFTCHQAVNAQVAEIPDPSFPDIAGIRVLPNGQVAIIYNPVICAQAGQALCGFYREHEHCHIQLGHTIRSIWPWQMELEADCCAAKIASNIQAAAAYNWFSSGGGATPTHGTGQQRAARILVCRQ